MKENIIEIAKNYAIKCHKDVNQKYDNHSYSFHLKMVYNYALKYMYLIPDGSIIIALASCWPHDTIEDARQTYNNVKKVLGVEIADIVYAVTNEKGKIRGQRANDKYYNEMKENDIAVFVKICDRLANTSYSKAKNSSMIESYTKEFDAFKSKLYKPEYDDMFVELESLSKIN